jgi:hypothetical protein
MRYEDYNDSDSYKDSYNNHYNIKNEGGYRNYQKKKKKNHQDHHGHHGHHDHQKNVGRTTEWKPQAKTNFKQENRQENRQANLNLSNPPTYQKREEFTNTPTTKGESLEEIFSKPMKSNHGDKNKVVEAIKSLNNNDKTKTIRALASILSCPHDKLLRFATKKYNGEKLFAAILVKERFNLPRFQLFLAPEDEINNIKDVAKLSIIEAKELVLEFNIDTRPSYAQRLRLAFLTTIEKLGTKNCKEFHYSVDGEHFTRAFTAIQKPEEKTISHEEARKIVEQEFNNTNILQTKTIKLFPTANGKFGNNSVIALKKRSIDTEKPHVHASTRETYQWEIHNNREEEYLLNNKSYKLVWPAQQINALKLLLNSCYHLITQKAADSLGGDDPAFAVIFERDSDYGTSIKAIMPQAKSKKEASVIAQEKILEVWPEHPQAPGEEKEETITLTCLSAKEAKDLIALLEADLGNKKL